MVDLIISAQISDRPMPWLEHAACGGAELETFFPEDERGRESVAARALCQSCPVSTECLGWALETGSTLGIYGGTTGAERRSILRKRGRRVRTH